MAASNLSLRPSYFCNPKAVLSQEKFNSQSAFKIMSAKEPEKLMISNNAHPVQLVMRNASNSQMRLSKWVTTGALSSMAANSDFSIQEDYSSPESQSAEMQFDLLHFDRVNYLVGVLIESAGNFSNAMQNLELDGKQSPLAKAWNGLDVNAWHKRIALDVAAYALLKATIEVEQFHSQNRPNPSLVNEILSPCKQYLQDHIESELNKRSPKLLQWFDMVELPWLTGSFVPFVKKWMTDYNGSGVAGTTMAITCCAAVGKLRSGRISCTLLLSSIDQALQELMGMAHDLVSLDNLHQLATEAGFEEEFLSHFGSKVLPIKSSEDRNFWFALVRKKLSAALEREGVIKGRHSISDKVQESNLATLALFAYLGRESRLFLSRNNVMDIDEHIQDLLSYLECGIIFIYPEFSTTSVYQLLMEVIVDEMCWLDLYAAYNGNLGRKRRRSKSKPTDAERETLFYTVFTACYDLISGFAHYNSSTKYTVDSHLLEFLLQSEGLLSVCSDEHSSAYIGTCDLPKTGPPSSLIRRTVMDELRTRGTKHRRASSQTEATSSSGAQPETSDHDSESEAEQSFFKKSIAKLVSATLDVWMGTQLLFIDISDCLRFLVKRCCGHKMTKRERQKTKRTLADVATLIPVTILMLLPVSAVGHAAMFAAIKKYVPCLIPSPYSEQRLDLMKQLKRTKKMEVTQADEPTQY